MKEANWNECIEDNSAIRISPDTERAESLIETAKERISLVHKIDEKNCNFVFEDYYTSLLEFLQALLIIKGYKVLNHLCLGFYLRDVLKREDLFRIFDTLRYKRNTLTYYGRKMDFDVCKEAIKKCNKAINEIKVLTKKYQ
ncbi:MAG: hypothetical protein J7L45_00835 [Candidatus Aenigmarchaeota archaeon]|nr:hypothetical protein [Candidatus Aenigmarchaeota archaeon]